MLKAESRKGNPIGRSERRTLGEASFTDDPPRILEVKSLGKGARVGILEDISWSGFTVGEILEEEKYKRNPGRGIPEKHYAEAGVQEVEP